MAKKLQIIGTRGKSAYQYALDGGYTGSEAEFKEKMARELEASYNYEDLNNKILATAIKQDASGTVISVSDAAAVPLLSLDYEGENVTFTVSGKNLLNTTGLVERTISGVKFTPYYTNGMLDYVLVNGTATSTIIYPIGSCDGVYLSVDKITLTGCPSGGSASTYMLAHATSGTADTGDGKELICKYLNNLNFTIKIMSGATVSNLKFYPMVKSATVADIIYEPYVGKSITVESPDKLNLNDFVMNHPVTNITNDQNLPMTIQYIADPQLYIDSLATSLTNAVVSLGGEV